MGILKIKNPYNGQLILSIKEDDFISINKKINSILKPKNKISNFRKINIFKKLKKKFLKERKKILNIITSEVGVSLKDSNYEFKRCIKCIELSIKILKRKNYINKTLLMTSNKNVRTEILETPLKFIFAITPFNLPFVLSAHKIFPAIISGSSIILKPSEKTPLSSIYLIDSLKKCGLPNKMVNYIISRNPKKIVNYILLKKDLDMISFTGSSNIGIKIKNKMIKFNHQLKKFVPELGGCSSLIICEDSNINRAVDIVIDGCFKYSGQRCTSIRRVIVANKIAKKFINNLLTKVKKLKFGNPFNLKTDIGPVIDSTVYKNARKRINKSLKDGAKLLYGSFVTNNVLSPIVLDNVKINMEIVAKETFGPICSIIRSKNLNEAIKFANTTNYKMAGAIVTKSTSKAIKAYSKIEVGQFSVNGPPGFRLEEVPFGGFGDSGNGEKEGLILASKSMQRIRVLYKH